MHLDRLNIQRKLQEEAWAEVWTESGEALAGTVALLRERQRDGAEQHRVGPLHPHTDGGPAVVHGAIR